MMQRLSDNILMLGNRYFKYFVVGQKRAVVLECGVTGGVSSFQQEWIQLDEKPEVQNILVMHEHFDHVCGIPALKELFPGVPVLAHAKTARVLGKASVVADFFYQDDKMSDVGGYQISDESIFPIFFQGYEMYIESIERMSTYPTRILALPHGRIWTGVLVHLFYRRALESVQKAYECIRKMLNDGVEQSAIEEKLFKCYYRDDLMIYTPTNIRLCVKLLVQRVKECL